MTDLIDDTTAPEDWYSADRATFGDRMAGAREALGLSQAELAKRLGVKLKTLRGWEDDQAEPRANRLQMVAGLLNVSIMWMLTGRGEGLDGPVDAAENAAPTEAVRDILTEMRTLSSEMRASAERLGRLEKRLRIAVSAQ